MIWHERIKALRESRNLTLKEVGKALGVSEATAQRYENSENGIKAIPYETIIDIANFYHVSPSYIMGWDNDENSLSPIALQLAHSYDRASIEDKEKLSMEEMIFLVKNGDIETLIEKEYSNEIFEIIKAYLKCGIKEKNMIRRALGLKEKEE